MKNVMLQSYTVFTELVEKIRIAVFYYIASKNETVYLVTRLNFILFKCESLRFAFPLLFIYIYIYNIIIVIIK